LADHDSITPLAIFGFAPWSFLLLALIKGGEQERQARTF
jgi:hypothetical protein